MSRIGSSPIIIPDSVTLTLEKGQITAKGPLGELILPLPPRITIKREENKLIFTRPSDEGSDRALHGLTRSLVANLITGISQGYRKNLQMIGTGYRVTRAGEGLSLTVGFSHPVTVAPISGIKFEVEGNDKITVVGIDKQLVGQVAANLRAIRPPEVYKGKGIRYQDELVRRKAGKAVKVGAAAA